MSLMPIQKRCRRMFFLVGLCLLLPACSMELYTNLEEREANQILSVLLGSGIDVQKIAGKERTWGLRINKADMAQAIQILEKEGLPRDRFESIGEVFKKQGLVSSPLQERILYLYALSQQISETISHIDGVLTARVLVVIPENNPLSDKIRPSSASVFVKHIEATDLQTSIPKIKQLVVDGIEGLSYENVTVVLFPSESTFLPLEAPHYRRIFLIDLSPGSVIPFWILVGGLALVSALIPIGIAYGLRYKRTSRAEGRQKGDSSLHPGADYTAS